MVDLISQAAGIEVIPKNYASKGTLEPAVLDAPTETVGPQMTWEKVFPGLADPLFSLAIGPADNDLVDIAYKLGHEEAAKLAPEEQNAAGRTGLVMRHLKRLKAERAAQQVATPSTAPSTTPSTHIAQPSTSTQVVAAPRPSTQVLIISASQKASTVNESPKPRRRKATTTVEEQPVAKKKVAKKKVTKKRRVKKRKPTGTAKGLTVAATRQASPKPAGMSPQQAIDKLQIEGLGLTPSSPDVQVELSWPKGTTLQRAAIEANWAILTNDEDNKPMQLALLRDRRYDGFTELPNLPPAPGGTMQVDVSGIQFEAVRGMFTFEFGIFEVALLIATGQ